MFPIEFDAPWSRSLKVTSSISAAILLGVMTVGMFADTLVLPVRILMIGVPTIILAATLMFSVRGYSLTDRELKIKRLIWTDTLSLKNLQSAHASAEAFKGAMRIAGNAGMLSFTGLFWSRQLGFFRIYGTDPSRAVILKFSKRTVVITPHDPQQFIMRAGTFIKTANFPP